MTNSLPIAMATTRPGWNPTRHLELPFLSSFLQSVHQQLFTVYLLERLWTPGTSALPVLLQGGPGFSVLKREHESTLLGVRGPGSATGPLLCVGL